MSDEQSMVERVARAIRIAYFERQKSLEGDEFRTYARAAIEAMRLPLDYCHTSPVVEAVQTEVDIWPEDKPRPAPNFVQFVSREEAVAIWNAGVDAALKP